VRRERSNPFRMFKYAAKTMCFSLLLMLAVAANDISSPAETIVKEQDWDEHVSPKEFKDSVPNGASDDLMYVPLYSQRTTSSPAGLREELLQEQGENETPLKNFGNTVFYAQIEIGTPPKPFKVVLDTGSFILWVPDAVCQSSACRVHNKFRVKDSSTGKVLGEKKVDGKVEVPAGIIQYGTGAMEGVMVSDTVKFAGISVPKAGMMVATQLARMPFLVSPFDGILGLGRQEQSHFGVNFNFMKQAQATGKIKKNIVSFYLTLKPAAAGGQDGTIVFGGTDPKFYDGQIRWHPVVEAGPPMWTIELTSLSVGNGQNLCPNTCVGIIDTGTSLLVTSEQIALAVNEGLKVQTDCTGLESAPTVDFVFGGSDHKYTLPAHAVVLEGENQLGEKACEAAIRPMGGPEMEAVAEKVGALRKQTFGTAARQLLGGGGDVRQKIARIVEGGDTPQAASTDAQKIARIIHGGDTPSKTDAAAAAAAAAAALKPPNPWKKITAEFGGKDVVLIGDLFLRHHFSAFDNDDPKNPKVGFASAKKSVGL